MEFCEKFIEQRAPRSGFVTFHYEIINHIDGSTARINAISLKVFILVSLSFYVLLGDVR